MQKQESHDFRRGSVKKAVSSAAHAEANALFVRYQNGDTNALAELYTRWQNYIIKRITHSNAFSCRLDIEEVASDVWIRVQQEALKWDIHRSSWFKFLDFATGKVIHDTIKRRDAYKRRSDDPAFQVSLDSESSATVPMEYLFSNEPSPLDRLIYNERLEVLKRAIAVCQFPHQARQILQLRLQGLQHAEIQSRLGIESPHQVPATLSHVFQQLRAAINPKTLEVQPPPLSKRSQRDQLAALGVQLSELCRKRGYKPLKLAKALDMRIEVLVTFLKGERKPSAPLLQRLASILGEGVYKIYSPPLTNYPYAAQGQQLWYARVQQGCTILRLARLVYLRSAASIRTYEHGTNRPTDARLTLISKTLSAPQLIGIYNNGTQEKSSL